MSKTSKNRSKAEKLDSLFSKICEQNSAKTLRPTRSVQFTLTAAKSQVIDLNSSDEAGNKTKVDLSPKERISQKIEKRREKLKRQSKGLKQLFLATEKEKYLNKPKTPQKHFLKPKKVIKKPFKDFLTPRSDRKNAFGQRVPQQSFHHFPAELVNPGSTPDGYKFYRENKYAISPLTLTRQRSEFSIPSESVLKKYSKKVTQLKSKIRVMLT